MIWYGMIRYVYSIVISSIFVQVMYVLICIVCNVCVRHICHVFSVMQGKANRIVNVHAKLNLR